MVSLDDVLAAREAAAGRLHRTPLFRSQTLGAIAGADVHLKAELFQKTGSFKPRGVLANLAALTPEQRDRGVISISAGNHAQALAWGAAAASEGRRVIGVEPELPPAMHEALAAGEPVPVEPRSIADGLSAPFAGTFALALCAELVEGIVLVTEAEIEEAFRFLYQRAKLACEPAGAVAVAALLARKIALEPGETAVAIVSGGNVATQTAVAILSER